MPRRLRLVDALHETLAVRNEQVTHIMEENAVLIARSRRAIDLSRELLRETDHLVRQTEHAFNGGAVKPVKIEK